MGQTLKIKTSIEKKRKKKKKENIFADY